MSINLSYYHYYFLAILEGISSIFFPHSEIVQGLKIAVLLGIAALLEKKKRNIFLIPTFV